jgi:transcriptional regulator with XRE-family HTH domain
MTDDLPGPLTREVAGIIRGLMARYNVSQTELAEVVGVSQSQLSKMTRGIRDISIDQLDLMCEAFTIEIQDVLEEAAKATDDIRSNPDNFIILDGERLDRPRRNVGGDSDTDDREQLPRLENPKRRGDLGLAAEEGKDEGYVTNDDDEGPDSGS